MPALCFPSPSEPESLAASAAAHPSVQAQEVKVDGKQETASPKGKSSPGPSQCGGCSMPGCAPSCAKRYLRLMVVLECSAGQWSSAGGTPNAGLKFT